MNEKLNEYEKDNSLSNAMARGALLWAPLYSIGSSAISYYLVADDSLEIIPFKELMLRNLVIISPVMLMAEAAGVGIREKMSVKRPSRRRRRMRIRFPKMPNISSRRNGNGLRPKHA